MERTEADVLAYMGFPREHWTQISSTNPIERVNREIKRRCDVIGIFPNDAAIIRLVGALMLEQNDEWAVCRRYMTPEGLAAISHNQTISLPAVAALITSNLSRNGVPTPRLGAQPVLHFASLSLVGASMADSFHYLRQNYVTGLNLVQACAVHGVKKIVFSSTAALFGGPERAEPIPETALVQPDSPYGESKFMVERILHWADRLYGVKSACLRYFNAAGADPHGRAGEDHRPETHLEGSKSPLVLRSAL